MKDTNYMGRKENSSSLAVSVTIDEAPLLKNLVEKLAHGRFDVCRSVQKMPVGLRAFDTSTIEAHVSGCIDMQEADAYMALAYITCFSFTCIRLRGSDNRLAWTNSLS